MFSPRTPSGRGRPSPYTHSHSRSLRLSSTTPRRNLRNLSHPANQSLHASQLFEETSQHRIEAFGAPLPVLITEALNLSDRSTTEITACIDHSGWAWLVGGRKLFVWRYRSSGGSRAVQCKELMLPPSDLAHSAERVCIIPSENDGQPAACVAVSPEGIVRYWPNIAFESSTAEISAELRGEECAKVINFQPHGCLLATTTSSLLLLEPVAGQVSIHCKPLKASQGLFSGLSKRMSSFIFGASPLQTNGAPLQTILAAPEDEYDDDDEEEDRRSFYVLSGNNLNKWQVPSIGPEKLLYQIDADRMFREALARKVWEQDSIQLPQLKTWLLDLQLTREGVVMLGAGVNLEAALVVYYALAYFETYDDAHPANVSDLILLDYTQRYTEESEDQLTEYKLLLPSESSNVVFIYSTNSILMLQDSTALDKMDFKTAGDCILGAGRSDGTAVFFSNSHGIFSVSPPATEASLLDESNNQTHFLSRHELSGVAASISRMSELTESEDSKAKLKAGFIASISGDQAQAVTLVEEMLLLARHDSEAQGSELDTAVAGVSKDLIDDYPNADPRWAESNRQDSTSSTASVIITQQLKDKEKAHDFFISFLKKYGLWDKLSVVSVRDSVMPTRLLLCEHVEKLQAAVALRELHAEHHKIVDTCINKALKQRKVAVPASLTPQDMFYREVSNIQDITGFLLTWEKDFLASDQPSLGTVKTVLAVNAILESMLHSALRYRQTHAELYAGSEEVIPEYIPWSATNSMRKTIIEQIGISLQKGVAEAREVDVQGVLFQNIVGLADIVMDGYASQLKSLQCHSDRLEDHAKLEREFERERHKIISSLLDHKQFDRAASLAEKFEDFELLMRICDMTNNHERLQRYHVQYAGKGFAQFMFGWYTKEGKRGHLLAQPIAQGDELSKFLDSDNLKYLSWLHEIKQGHFLAAHKALSDLASKEKNFLAKKKTLLSLSKLSALAADDADDTLHEEIEGINDELDLILHQELLPSETLQNVGMDPENMRVLSPEELIEIQGETWMLRHKVFYQHRTNIINTNDHRELVAAALEIWQIGLYIGDKNSSPSELDVKKALDLLRYIEKSTDEADYEALKLHIWCRAILMDNWLDDEDDERDPLESNGAKIFFRTVDLVYMDNELELLLPDLNQLLAAEELGDLRKESKFKFLLKGGYEQIKNSMSQME